MEGFKTDVAVPEKQFICFICPRAFSQLKENYNDVGVCLKV